MNRRAAIAAAAAITLVVITATVTAAFVRATTPDWPDADSVEVGFAQDMMVHHAQAVEMAELIRGRTTDGRIAALAADIALTQQAQIGRMQGWLALWDQPQASVGPRMGWMGHPVDEMMPGMATREELVALAEADAAEAQPQFLRLMIDHHLAGVEMAEAAAARAEVADVRRVAEAMVDGQEAEIEAMRKLLEELHGGGPST